MKSEVTIKALMVLNTISQNLELFNILSGYRSAFITDINSFGITRSKPNFTLDIGHHIDIFSNWMVLQEKILIMM
jgi:hypothetical protein